jgi:hypothetical protein
MLGPTDIAVLPTVIWVHLLAQGILAVIPRRPTLAPLNLVLASSRHCTLPALQLRCWLAPSQVRVREWPWSKRDCLGDNTLGDASQTSRGYAHALTVL